MGRGDGEGADADEVTRLANDVCLFAGEALDLVAVLLLLGVAKRECRLDLVLLCLRQVLHGPVRQSRALRVAAHHEHRVRALGVGLCDQSLHLGDAYGVGAAAEEVGCKASGVCVVQENLWSAYRVFNSAYVMLIFLSPCFSSSFFLFSYCLPPSLSIQSTLKLTVNALNGNVSSSKLGLDTVGGGWTADGPHVADLGRSTGEYHDDRLAAPHGELFGYGTDSTSEELTVFKDASRAGRGQCGDQKGESGCGLHCR